MKKLFALVLIVCMLSVAAFAEVTVSAANICDAAGNVVGAAELAVEDYTNRSNITDTGVADRLTKAFEWVKYDVQYNETLAADIDSALAGKSMELTSSDLIIVEMFDIALGEIAEGNYAEITVTLEEGKVMPQIVTFTADGITWEVVEYTTEGNTITFKANRSGAVAFLLDHKLVLTEGEVSEKLVATESTTIITAGAETFTKSVYGKTAPSVTVIEGGIAVITDATGAEIVVPNEAGHLVVTPVSERNEAADVRVRENLNWAYESILNAESVDALVEEELGDMIVRDLFDVSLYGEYKAVFAQEGATVEVTFDADIDSAKGFAVLCSHDFATWHTIAAENVSVNANGTVTVKLAEAGALAFAVEADDTVEGGVVSPN